MLQRQGHYRPSSLGLTRAMLYIVGRCSLCWNGYDGGRLWLCVCCGNNCCLWPITWHGHESNSPQDAPYPSEEEDPASEKLCSSHKKVDAESGNVVYVVSADICARRKHTKPSDDGAETWNKNIQDKADDSEPYRHLRDGFPHCWWFFLYNDGGGTRLGWVGGVSGRHDECWSCTLRF